MIGKVLRPDGVQLNWLYAPTLTRAYVTLSPSARIITRPIWLLSSPTNGTLTPTSTHPVTIVLSTKNSRQGPSTANFSLSSIRRLVKCRFGWLRYRAFESCLGKNCMQSTERITGLTIFRHSHRLLGRHAYPNTITDPPNSSKRISIVTALVPPQLRPYYRSFALRL